MEELSCPICFESYDFKLHRPLLLPECGHTFCKACLQSKQQCPDDRSTIRPGKLPTNMLALRSIEFRGERIPGVAGQVKLIRSGELELQDKVGEGGSGEVWRACYHHKMVGRVRKHPLSLMTSLSRTNSQHCAGCSCVHLINGCAVSAELLIALLCWFASFRWL
jgi:hypothetical protein